MAGIPSRSGKSEAVRQLTAQSLPELLFLLFGKLEQVVVVLLELLVILLEWCIVAPTTTGSLRVAATTTATASAFTLQVKNDISIGLHKYEVIDPFCDSL